MDQREPVPPELIDALLEATRRLSTQTVFFHQAAARYLGLHITDHKCLDIVLGMGRATAGQLAELTGLTTGAITSVINRLEKAGFVRRTKDPRDLRIVYVEPIPDNLRPLADIFGPLGGAMSELFSRYGEGELRLILDYLERSIRVLARETERLKGANGAPSAPKNGT
ncbi:MAG: MarR family transcriptional regulator [Thermobacillus sp. ZCTH02-B1]|uniref:MarR family winged helix-turn-helix transcriptional regulator n=1 Tax=Thermobacillus sp. ZCTH02-B1 TaxID=1858795 RepID=UPI000B562A64|nr:MarR family transcriptional regulator [Thermobacillus sp. ZCTH02-B1]OUM97403.1 MAG: MarR family transcriptional regulator [Thermobacillus sp. ZCTH02-B1]